MNFKLISFKLCPFVQRSVITLKQKKVSFDIEFIDLSNKPEWFLKISPLGKVPVLVVDESTVLFESAVINEFIDEVTDGSMLETDSLKKAKQRAWVEFSSNCVGDQYRLGKEQTKEGYEEKKRVFFDRLAKFEAELDDRPFFQSDSMTLVDTAIAPVFMRASMLERVKNEMEEWKKIPKVSAWSRNLLAQEAVQASVVPEFKELFSESAKGFFAAG